MAAVAEFPNETRGWVVAKQFAKAATSIGANVWEADAALTDADFAHKISIARKESSETEYWLQLARRSDLLPEGTYESLLCEAMELTKILGAIVRKTQEHTRRASDRRHGRQ